MIHPGLAGVSKKDLQEKLCKMYKVQDNSCCLLFGFKVAFGGGRSTGFGMIYDSLVAAKKFEPKYRLTRVRGHLPALLLAPPLLAPHIPCSPLPLLLLAHFARCAAVEC